MATLCWKLLNPRVKEKVVRGVEGSSVAEGLSSAHRALGSCPAGEKAEVSIEVGVKTEKDGG